MLRPHHKFVDFVEANKHKLVLSQLQTLQEYVLQDGDPVTGGYSSNPSPDATHVLRANPGLVWWPKIMKNPGCGVASLLRKHPHEWVADCTSALLSSNTNTDTLALLEEFDIVPNWLKLSSNPAEGAVDRVIRRGCFMEEALALNTNPRALRLLFEVAGADPYRFGAHLSMNHSKEAMDIVTGPLGRPAPLFMAANPFASAYILSNISRFSSEASRGLSLNSNPSVVALLRARPADVCLRIASRNPGAIDLLRHNVDKIDWFRISSNPSIYELDYARMRAEMAPLRTELLARVMHPSNVLKLAGIGF